MASDEFWTVTVVWVHNGHLVQLACAHLTPPLASVLQSISSKEEESLSTGLRLVPYVRARGSVRLTGAYWRLGALTSSVGLISTMLSDGDNVTL